MLMQMETDGEQTEGWHVVQVRHAHLYASNAYAVPSHLDFYSTADNKTKDVYKFDREVYTSKGSGHAGNRLPCYRNDSQSQFNLILDNVHVYGRGKPLS